MLAAACVMVACATDQREEPSSATLTVTLGPEVTSEPSSEGGSEAATEAQTSAADSGGEKLDVGGGTGMMEGGDTTLGCKKVDLLFVVDGSGSMADEQANLLTAFPAFIDSQGARTRRLSIAGFPLVSASNARPRQPALRTRRHPTS